MSGFNKTGPRGLGPMTGKGLGYCSKGIKQGWDSVVRGFGHGRGWHSYPPTNEGQKSALEKEKEALRN